MGCLGIRVSSFDAPERVCSEFPRMSHEEIERGMSLLEQLNKEKNQNSAEMTYDHLPERSLKLS